MINVFFVRFTEFVNEGMGVDFVEMDTPIEEQMLDPYNMPALFVVKVEARDKNLFHQSYKVALCRGSARRDH